MQRRKPFSNKQKKLQLQQKRRRNRHKDVVVSTRRSNSPAAAGSGSLESQSGSDEDFGLSLEASNSPPAARGKREYDPKRFQLQFERESREELERRKAEAKRLPIKPLLSVEEVGVDDIYRPGSVLDIPKRPPWNYSMSKAQVERQEERMFSRYLQDVHSKYRKEELSYFEHNLETWRQLWRVLEISDVILLIADVRHPALHFSPALYKHVVEELKKKLILVLNKVDLVPPQVAVAWRHYFLSEFPELSVICFTCYPDRDVSLEPSKKVKLKLKRKGQKLSSAVGPRELFRVIEQMYKGTVEMVAWQKKLDNNNQPPRESDGEDSSEDEDDQTEPVAATTHLDSGSPLVDDGSKDGILTIGLVGHPNVGKSSILNGLLGEKAVSTSRTPGHTKHFQTIFLTPSVKLCDCPGLVFPSLVRKQLQILSGMYPVAQVQEPYSVVGYLAARVPLVDLLRLEHPNPDLLGDAKRRPEKLEPTGSNTVGEENNSARANSVQEGEDMERDSGKGYATDGQFWTPWDVCDAWALKKGFLTKKAGRPDTYRAANNILRLAADGRILLFFCPPGYSSSKGRWERHPEVSEMMSLQQRGLTSSAKPTAATSSGSDSDSEDNDATTVYMQGPQANKFALLSTTTE